MPNIYTVAEQFPIGTRVQTRAGYGLVVSASEALRGDDAAAQFGSAYRRVASDTLYVAVRLDSSGDVSGWLPHNLTVIAAEFPTVEVKRLAAKFPIGAKVVTRWGRTAEVVSADEVADQSSIKAKHGSVYGRDDRIYIALQRDGEERAFGLPPDCLDLVPTRRAAEPDNVDLAVAVMYSDIEDDVATQIIRKLLA